MCFSKLLILCFSTLAVKLLAQKGEKSQFSFLAEHPSKPSARDRAFSQPKYAQNFETGLSTVIRANIDAGGNLYEPILCDSTLVCGCSWGEVQCGLCPNDLGSSFVNNQVCYCDDVFGPDHIARPSKGYVECNPKKLGGPFQYNILEQAKGNAGIPLGGSNRDKEFSYLDAREKECGKDKNCLVSNVDQKLRNCNKYNSYLKEQICGRYKCGKDGSGQPSWFTELAGQLKCCISARDLSYKFTIHREDTKYFHQACQTCKYWARVRDSCAMR